MAYTTGKKTTPKNSFKPCKGCPTPAACKRAKKCKKRS